MSRNGQNGRSASNGHGIAGASFANGNGGPSSITIDGSHLGAGDNHWWKLV